MIEYTEIASKLKIDAHDLILYWTELFTSVKALLKVDGARRTWWKQQKYFVSPFRPYIVLLDNLFSTHLISTALTAIWAPNIP